MTAVVEPTSPALPEPPELRERDEDGQRLGALLWRPGPGWRAVSSAVLGGGIGERAWVMNAQVAHGYTRTDPEAHLAALARRAGLDGPGVGLMTAAEVARHGAARDGGVDAVATAGIDVRGWAAAPVAGVPGPQAPGTINIVVTVPAPLTDAALVNAVATATEAKVQALLDAGLDCSGTPTDAVCVLARTPRTGGLAEPFAGPRSLWGARLARAVHAAVGAALPGPGVS
ncbi:adenosylcobinamide amidohydrolase [Streptomyces hydrogenans]|uniref:Adenosylcobinamide amidohydrolase n=2 Tax=Streptomyces hydrogenans TaxID=1873719 RepID=A0ABQ3PJZ6_9ACTN|nr:adenosylcobinamide amidohydrolase [Streptomyces hydrogenans]GHI25355.1 adenosylcobinamide amidohydrolase [Streptomyces hydrogenans]